MATFIRTNIDDPTYRTFYLERRFGTNVLFLKFNPNHDVRGRFTSGEDSVRNAMRTDIADEKSRTWIKKHKLAGHVSIVTLKGSGVKVIEKSVSQHDFEKKGYSGATSAIAYELGKELGFNNIPITALLDDNWTIRSQFVEGQTLADKNTKEIEQLVDEGVLNNKDAQRIAIMAYLKHDPDMHGGNILVDKSGKLWAIDMDGWSTNSSASWKGKRRGLSKVMAGKEVDKQIIRQMDNFVKNSDEIYEKKFSDSVPKSEWKAIVRRAGKVVKKGVIP